MRYAAGVGLVQAGWVVRLLLPHPADYVGFPVLVVAEIAVPVWAEYRGTRTSWHPGHIAERYGLFTIIVLGEVILGTLTGIQSALSNQGVSGAVLLIAAGGLVLVFALWWTYFTGEDASFGTMRTSLAWGYGHYFVFVAVAAVGAGLQAAIDASGRGAHVSAMTAAFTVAVPVAVFQLVLAWLHRLTNTGAAAHLALAVGGAVLVLVLALTPGLIGIGGTVLAIGLATAATLAANFAVTHHPRR